MFFLSFTPSMDFATARAPDTLNIRLMPMTKQLGFGDRFALGCADGTGPHGMRLQHSVGAIGALFDEISVAHKALP
jgi:hypothetical protein